jgi:hypothetical protein
MAQDPAENILKNATGVPDPIKALAWDAFHLSKSKTDFQKRIGALPLSDDVKADLWDLKYSPQQVNTNVAPEQMATEAMRASGIPANVSRQAMGSNNSVSPEYLHPDVQGAGLTNMGTLGMAATPENVEFSSGVLKQFAGDALRGEKAALHAAVSDYPGAVSALRTPTPESLQPSTPVEHAGTVGGTVAEFAAPGGVISKANKALEGAAFLTKLSPVARALILAGGRAGTNATAAAGVEAVQGGSPKEIAETGASGAAGSVLADTLAALAQRLGSTTPIQRLIQALKPSVNQRNFETSLATAVPEIQKVEQQTGQHVNNLDVLLDHTRQAKNDVWQKIEQSFQNAEANAANPKGTKLLPPAKTPIEAGVQQIRPTDTPGALIPAESRTAIASGEPVPQSASEQIRAGIQAQAAKRELGSTAATVPNRLMPQNPIVEKIGTQSAAVPQTVFASKLENGTQYLSGGAHPEMSGELTNPGVMMTSDQKAAAATLDRLENIAANPRHFESFSPSEQASIREQISRLKGIVPTPGQTYNLKGITIDGGQIADAISASVPERTRLLYPEEAARVDGIAEKYRRPLNVRQAEAFLQQANSDLNGFYRGNLNSQYAAKSNTDVMAVKAEAEALRSALDQKLSEIPGQFDNLKKLYGSLRDVELAVVPRAIVASRQAPMSLGEQISFVRGAGHAVKGVLTGNGMEVARGVGEAALSRAVKQANTSDRLTAKAFKQLRRGNAKARIQDALRSQNIPSTTAALGGVYVKREK